MEDATFAAPPVAQLARAQFIAMMECYRRLFFVWCLVPIALLVIPMSVAAYLSIIDYWTRSALVCTILTLALTVAAVRFIRQRAPSTKAFYGGLQRQGLRIFLCLFTVSCTATRLAVAPLLQTIITTSKGSLFQYTTWWLLLDTSLRLAAGAAILGLAVVFRFVGPNSLGKYFATLQDLRARLCSNYANVLSCRCSLCYSSSMFDRSVSVSPFVSGDTISLGQVHIC